MKQIIQNLNNGSTKVENIPVPRVGKGQLLIRTSKTLISPGTERMLVKFGQANLINKARQQPEKVKQVIEKIKTDGLVPTIEKVFNKLNQPLPLGYCNVGQIIDVGEGVHNFKVGDRVVSNGKHAEVVNVPVNLCAKIPDNVSDESSSFTILGAVALQGIRLSKPTLGEAFVVLGLGLIGLITVQLLRANGCRVLGIDFDKRKLQLAKKFGAEVFDMSTKEDPIEFSKTFSRGRGVDAVIITATTKSNSPIHNAAQMSRKRGRIILVGVSGLELSRDDFYEKELTFQVSSSYGPGRYDPNYEEKGVDYPVGFVRWTEQRNFEAVLDMLKDNKLIVDEMISHQFNINNAEKAYQIVSSKDNSSLGMILDYPKLRIKKYEQTIILNKKIENHNHSKNINPSISFIGSGNYATSQLIPAFKKAGVRLLSILSNNGLTGTYAARKFGFYETTTEIDRVLKNKSCKAVVISTRHDTHAKYIIRALDAGKHVFVEKPLCLNLDQLSKIVASYKRSNISPLLMIGFNRRFAPHIQKIKELIQKEIEPKSFILTINSGIIPMDHWTQDIEVGGGRIIGEVCHFIDLLRFLVGVPVISWKKSVMKNSSNDTLSIQLDYEDGSIGTIHYFSNGSPSFPKERLEIFSKGKILILDNYRKLTGVSWPNFNKMNLWRQDKGQINCVNMFVRAIKDNNVSPIPLKEIIEVSKISIEISE